MKTKIIETHFVLSPLLSEINGEKEYDFIPMIKRIKYIRFLGIWIPIKNQSIRQILNQYIHSATFGDNLSYDKYWHKDLKNVTKVIYT